jgi:hypothetical protein
MLVRPLCFTARILEALPSADNPRWSHRGHHIGTEGMPFYRGWELTQK